MPPRAVFPGFPKNFTENTNFGNSLAYPQFRIWRNAEKPVKHGFESIR
jgi:hypothetical protein